jgi:hypothetical protein
VTVVRLAQPKNALSPTSLTALGIVTLSGMVMLARLLRPRNAAKPRSVTLSGIVMPGRLLQPSKPRRPMWWTVFGIVTLVSAVQPKNAKSGIRGVLADMLTLVTRMQSANAEAPIVVTPSGLVTLVRRVQSRHASSARMVTVLGMHRSAPLGSNRGIVARGQSGFYAGALPPAQPWNGPVGANGPPSNSARNAGCPSAHNMSASRILPVMAEYLTRSSSGKKDSTAAMSVVLPTAPAALQA